MSKTLKTLVTNAILVLGLVTLLQAQPPTTSGGSGWSLLNLDNTIAVHGYDPVGYFSRNKAVKGNKRILERLGMATYYFASRSNRYEFLGNPTKYQPQFGGYCATSLYQGKLDDINPQMFAIYKDRLYLFKDEGARAAFLTNPEMVIKGASQRYFELAQRRREN